MRVVVKTRSFVPILNAVYSSRILLFTPQRSDVVTGRDYGEQERNKARERTQLTN